MTLLRGLSILALAMAYVLACDLAARRWPSLVAAWWRAGALGAGTLAVFFAATGHPFLAAWCGVGCGFGLYLSAVMR